jgi:hypothetical protein
LAIAAQARALSPRQLPRSTHGVERRRRAGAESVMDQAFVEVWSVHQEREVEVGADRSPYLAAQLALERWQPDQVQVMVAVGAVRPADVVEADSALIGG